MCKECEHYKQIGETNCPDCGFNLTLLDGAPREEIVPLQRVVREHGCAPQPWIAEPTRAGWWVAGSGSLRQLYLVQWAWIMAPTEAGWCYETIVGRKKCSDLRGWRWFGPVELPEMSNVEKP